MDFIGIKYSGKYTNFAIDFETGWYLVTDQ
jgi:hypothetical protein